MFSRKVPRWAFIFLCWSCLTASPLPVLAEVALHTSSFLEDPSNTLTIADVQSAALDSQFKPFVGILNRGYSSSAFWIKLNIQPDASSAQSRQVFAQGYGRNFILRVQPSYLDEVALYDPLELGDMPRFVGDRHPVPKDEYRSLNHNFTIAMGERPRTVWLRLKTNSTSMIKVQALPLEQAVARDGTQNLWLGVFIGSLILFWAWGLTHWLAHREPVIGFLVLSQFFSLVFALSILGYLRFIFGEYVTPAFLDLFTMAMAVVSTAASVYFNINFLVEYKPPPAALRMLRALVWFLPVGLLLTLTGYARLAMHANMLIVALAPLVLLFAALRSTIWGEPDAEPLFSRASLALYYGVSVALLVVFVLPSLGVASSSELALMTNPVYGFITGLLIVAMMQRRAQSLSDKHIRAEGQLVLAQQTVEQETQHRKEQVQFMAMITHELKTPLSVVRLALGANAKSEKMKARADQAIEDMSRVIDRCAWIDQLHELEFVLDNTSFNVVEETQRLVYVLNSSGRIKFTFAAAKLEITTDIRLFSTVINNLLDNALKYSEDASTIIVKAATSELLGSEGIVVTVGNKPGDAGWPAADKLFQKYYRSAGASRQTGSGLGLYQCAAIAKRLGGEMRHAAGEDLLVFELWLPR